MIRLLSFLLLAITLTACANNENSTGERGQMLDELDPNRENKVQNTSNLDDKLGYVNYTRDQLNGDESQHEATIDRTKMADMIARIILRTDGFNRVATLVTDEEVLIAYDREEDLDAKRAADIASKTAVSVMPGFYHVYVSDNEMLIQDIQSLHNSSSADKDYDNTLNQIISRMKESPQGVENREDAAD